MSRKKIALALVVVLALGYGLYRLFNPYASFLDLCRNGSLEEVRKAMADGAQLNPELEPLATYFEEDWPPSIYVKTTHEDGIATHVLHNDDAPYSRLRNTVFKLLLNYPDELPLHAALRCNPDPEVGIELIRHGARDSDGYLYRAFFLALQRGLDSRGQFAPAEKRSHDLERRGMKPDGAAPRIIAAILESSPRSFKDAYAVHQLFSWAMAPDDLEIYGVLLRDRNFRAIVAANDSGSYVDSMLSWVARSSAHPEVIGLLAEAGAAPNLRGKWGATPLGYAICKSKTPGMLKALLEHGADPNLMSKETVDDAPGGRKRPYENAPPLVLAILHGKYAEADLLLEAGADPALCVSAKDRSWSDDVEEDKSAFEYALDYALPAGQLDLTRKTYAAMPVRSRAERTLVFATVLNREDDAAFKLAQEIQKDGVDFGLFIKGQNLAAHYVKNGQGALDPQRLEYLARNGVKVDARERLADRELAKYREPFFYTALQAAVHFRFGNANYFETVKVLLFLGADPGQHEDNDDSYYAAGVFVRHLEHSTWRFSRNNSLADYEKYEQSVEAFVKSRNGRVRPNESNKESTPVYPVHFVCGLGMGSPKTLKLLLDAGAKPNETISGNFTSLHLLVLASGNRTNTGPQTDEFVPYWMTQKLMPYANVPSYLAAEREKRLLEAAAILLTRGAKADAANWRGATPMFYAVVFSDMPEAWLPFLVKHGAKADSLGPDGRTLAEWALELPQSRRPAALRSLRSVNAPLPEAARAALER